MSAPQGLILVVEDDLVQQELTLATLIHIGVATPVHCLPSGNAAIAYIRGDGKYVDRTRFPNPTLIITDLQMPDGDGYVLLRHLSTHPSESPCAVVVFSGVDDADHVIRAKQLGASAYIVKPTTFVATCRALQALFHAGS